MFQFQNHRENSSSNQIDTLVFGYSPYINWNSLEMSGLRFLNKVTIVTGGSKGIGAGIGIVVERLLFVVEEFVKNGSKVVFCCRNSAEGEAFVKITAFFVMSRKRR